MSELAELSAEAQRRVAAVVDDPEARLKLREGFYREYGATFSGDAGLGNSELAFLRWEIDRGVLNPLDHPDTPGSPWWRAVNEDFLVDAELARLCYQASVKSTDPTLAPAPRRWLRYLERPDPRTWYCAHNASIVAGYLRRIPETKEESRYERIFMNLVLYRLLYAHALVEDAQRGWGPLGEFLANPRGEAVEMVVQVPDFYPQNYPLTEEGIRDVLHRGHSLTEIASRILDQWIIVPQLGRLYSLAAHWVGIPELNTLVHGNRPSYPDLLPLSRRQWLIHRIVAFARSLVGWFRRA